MFLTPGGGYRQDVCNSESDSDHGDHGEMRTDENMYTKEMLGPDGKRIDGPPVISTASANAQRVAVSLTISRPGCSSEFTTTGMDTGVGSDSIWSRSPTPLNSDDDSEELTEDQKRKLTTAKNMAGRAGGQDTVRAPG
jgi:hypothetical protein